MSIKKKMSMKKSTRMKPSRPGARRVTSAAKASEMVPWKAIW